MTNIHQYWVYILSNANRTVLYIGVTNDLYRRYCEHKSGKIEGFSRRYRCHDLLYYESFQSIEEAIGREKSLKGWRREKKDALIRTTNPSLKDLSGEVFAFGTE
ncbi:MAG: GIY-YIG nuclease family protein [Phocaeicola plebeius]|nr:GIY-YIG nuclease family protein [Phocaeicola plebeius]